MAGAGFKTFNTGDVLTASDVNTYLMQQTVMVFADSSARSTALGANVAEGMISYLKDTNAVEVYNGSAWVSSDDPNAIQNTIVDAKGDIITATANDTPARLAVGTNDQVLTADSTTSTGLKWATAPTPTNPLFRVKLSADQSITAATFTKIAWNTETYDTANCFDSTTNYRFTPTTAGYYQLNASVTLKGNSGAETAIQFRYNGTSQITGGTGSVISSFGYGVAVISDIYYFNGSTDYVEVWAYIGAGTTKIGSGTDAIFSGAWLRS